MSSFYGSRVDFARSYLLFLVGCTSIRSEVPYLRQTTSPPTPSPSSPTHIHTKIKRFSARFMREFGHIPLKVSRLNMYYPVLQSTYPGTRVVVAAYYLATSMLPCLTDVCVCACVCFKMLGDYSLLFDTRLLLRLRAIYCTETDYSVRLLYVVAKYLQV